MKKLRYALQVLTVMLMLNVCFAFTTTGPLFPTLTSGNTNTIGGGTILWINDTNIKAADGVFATCTPGISTTDDLRGGGFGFTIAGTDVINGITLEVSAKAATGGAENFNTVVLEGGGGASANRAAGTLSTTNSVFTFGSAADLWGTTWTPAQINAAGFVGNVTLSSPGGAGLVSVDFFRVTVTSTAGAAGGMGRRVIRSQTRILGTARQGL